MAQEFSNPEKNSAHTKNGPVCRLSHSPNSLISQNCPITPKPIYIFWYGYSVLVNTACDTVCLWLRDKARLFRCTSWWVLLVCSGVPVGGYCLSVQAYQLVATACLFRRTSWWVLLVCSGVPVGGYCLSVQAYQLVGTACLFRCTSWWLLLVCSGVPVGGYCLSVQAYQLVVTACLFRRTSWWVLLVCSGVPVGGYCLSVQVYQLVGTACLFRCTSWWVLLVCSGVPVGGYCPSHGTSVIAQPCLLTYTSWRVWLARGGWVGSVTQHNHAYWHTPGKGYGWPGVRGWGVSPNTTMPIDIHQVKGTAGQGCVGGECHPTQPSLLTYTRYRVWLAGGCGGGVCRSGASNNTTKPTDVHQVKGLAGWVGGGGGGIKLNTTKVSNPDWQLQQHIFQLFPNKEWKQNCSHFSHCVSPSSDSSAALLSSLPWLVTPYPVPASSQTDRTVCYPPTPLHTLTTNRQDCSPPFTHWQQTDRTVPQPPLHTLTTDRTVPPPPHLTTDRTVPPHTPTPDNKQTGLLPHPTLHTLTTDRTVPQPPLHTLTTDRTVPPPHLTTGRTVPPPPHPHPRQQTDRTVTPPHPSHTDNRQDCSPPPDNRQDCSPPLPHTDNRQDCYPTLHTLTTDRTVPHPTLHTLTTDRTVPHPTPSHTDNRQDCSPPPPPPTTDRTVPPPSTHWQQTDRTVPPPFTHWQQTDGHWSLLFFRSLEFSDCNQEWQRREDRRQSLHGL